MSYASYEFLQLVGGETPLYILPGDDKTVYTEGALFASPDELHLFALPGNGMSGGSLLAYRPYKQYTVQRIPAFYPSGVAGGGIDDSAAYGNGAMEVGTGLRRRKHRAEKSSDRVFVAGASQKLYPASGSGLKKRKSTKTKVKKHHKPLLMY